MGNQLHKGTPTKSQFFSSIHVQKTANNQSLVCRRMVNHGKVREKWEEMVTKLRNVPNQHIMVPKEWRVLGGNFCGSGEMVEIQYENYASNLSELIEERATAGKYFQESQLWYVLYALCEVGRNCHSLGCRIGDIRPSTIMMNRQGQIKVLTLLSFPNDIIPFSDHSSKALFSPQQLQMRKKGYMQNISDHVKNQSFSIGLTVLSMAVLQNMKVIYQLNQGEINTKILAGNLDKMSNINYYSSFNKRSAKYSESLYQGIAMMLTEDQERLGYLQLYRQLEPYLQYIQEFKPFKVELRVNEDEEPNQGKKFPKEVITLKSRHKKQKIQKPSIVPQRQVITEVLHIPQTPMIESRFVGHHPSPPLYQPPSYLSYEQPSYSHPQPQHNKDVFRQIDERLKRSRQQFPS